jgi:AAA domain/Zinc-binding domain of primase-helicase
MLADDFQAWIARARAVPIESIIAQRRITLRRSGAERIGPCPKCGGRDRFSINIKHGVWNCRQCKPQDIAGDVIGLVEWLDGVEFTQAVETLAGPQPTNAKGGNGHDRGAALGPIVATYDYTDETGALLFQVTRHEPKTFRQRRPNGRGGWIHDTKGVRLVPYRLSQLMEATAQEQTLLIVEGEKNVDDAIALGVPATCNPRGAGKWNNCQIDDYFMGAHVVVIPDNDAQSRKATGELMFHPDGRPRFVGWDHAMDVGRALTGIAASVRVLDLATEWPDCPEGGDISDWIEAGGTIEQIYAMAERVPQWTPELQHSSARAGTNGQGGGQGLGEWDAGDEPGPIPPREWLLGNQFCRGFISSIVAAGGCGKTALRLLQFISLAIGRSLCGQHVFRRCRVLVISLEDDGNELQRRIKAVLDHHKIARAELKGQLFCASPKLAKLAEMKNRTRAIGPLEQQIRAAIERRKPDLISLDPFVKTHSLEENDSGDMDFVCDLLARMAVEFNLAVDSPHHVHKGQVTPGDADSGRGSSGIRDAGRLVYTLCPMSEAEAKTFDINPEDRGSYIRLDTAKVNIAARSAKATWFRIVGEAIGNGTPEYPNGDTVQVVETWSPPSTWADTTAEGLNAILNEIARGTDTGQRYSNAPKAAGERPVWPVVQKHYPKKTERQCREIIHSWLASELLYSDDYLDPVQRKQRKGLYVDDAKRPS